jgi:hypothetical protein
VSNCSSAIRTTFACVLKLAFVIPWRVGINNLVLFQVSLLNVLLIERVLKPHFSLYSKFAT